MLRPCNHDDSASRSKPSDYLSLSSALLISFAWMVTASFHGSASLACQPCLRRDHTCWPLRSLVVLWGNEPWSRNCHRFMNFFHRCMLAVTGISMSGYSEVSRENIQLLVRSSAKRLLIPSSILARTVKHNTLMAFGVESLWCSFY